MDDVSISMLFWKQNTEPVVRKLTARVNYYLLECREGEDSIRERCGGRPGARLDRDPEGAR